MMEFTLIPHRVTIGAILLDHRVPGWADKIRRPFNMASQRTCVLAQLLGSFRKGAERLDLNEHQTLVMGFQSSHELGPDLRRIARYYVELTAMWMTEIERRTQ